MKFAHLVWRFLWHKPGRTVLTLLSMVAAFLLLGVMQTVEYALSHPSPAFGSDILVVFNRASYSLPLPYAYRHAIESIPGVGLVSVGGHVSGYYKDPKNTLTADAVDPVPFFTLRRDQIGISEDQLRALQATRTGAIVGPRIARKYGWNVGDRITLHANGSYIQHSGSIDWPFIIVGVFTVKASPETVTVFPVKFTNSAAEGNVTLRGMGAQGLALHPTIHMTDGRAFRPGLAEMLVGSGVAGQFQGFSTGDHVKVGNFVWTVVGHFESHDIHDSEVLADANLAQSAADMGSHYNTIYVRLPSAQGGQAFKDEIARNPTLHVDAQSESQYFAAQSAGLSGTLTLVAYLMGAIMACGALFGAIHSLYISADTRRVEMATLRAIGFGNGDVVVAFLIEALALALLGGSSGAALAWLLFNGHTTTTMYGGLSQVVFQLQVPFHLIVSGVFWACAIGLLGALIPAVRAARLPIAAALRR